MNNSDLPDTSCIATTRRCSVASSGLRRTVTLGSCESRVMSVNDMECFIDRWTFIPSSMPMVASSPSLRDRATLLATVTSSIVPASPISSFNLDTNPIRNEPTSGSINQSVRLSRRVRPLRVVAAFGKRRWTVTPPYKNFLNFVSNTAHSSASSLLSDERNEYSGRDVDCLPLLDTSSPFLATSDRSKRQSFIESFLSNSGGRGSSVIS
mmetsp:Transcript_16475/g.35661  ORF Transcript_16475/g.35661 Transcript_16475/m.35661 type:complete len:209 (-) Transcript_16475:2345-2971(-)